MAKSRSVPTTTLTKLCLAVGASLFAALPPLAIAQASSNSSSAASPNPEPKTDFVSSMSLTQVLSQVGGTIEPLSVSTGTGGSTSNQTSNSVNVTVNGHTVTVPPNGTVSQTITSPDGHSRTSVNISSNQSSSGNASSSSQHVTSDLNSTINTEQTDN